MSALAPAPRPRGANEPPRFSLFEHLEELRSRLLKLLLAVIVLGGFSLYFSREIFGFLMRPILDALPEGARALVYTSGIEEFNVLLKVGCYAGLFLSVPVALYQLWRFIAPGLLLRERRFVAPFVVAGTVFFVGGAAFCYKAVLPTMFQFLLGSNERGAAHRELDADRARLEDAARFLTLGEAEAAMGLVSRPSPDGASTLDSLAAADKGNLVDDSATRGRGDLIDDSALERRGDPIDDSAFKHRAERLGALLDRALSAKGLDAAALSDAVALRRRALEADASQRVALLDRAALAWVRSLGPSTSAPAMRVWAAEKSNADQAAALARDEWTRPMLSMNEQLSLVLMLEVAFGAIFELPLAMALLAAMGLLRFRWVYRGQRYMVLGCVVAAAVLTPTGDVVNLALMAMPMIVCFELGVLLVWLFERRRDARAAAEAEG